MNINLFSHIGIGRHWKHLWRHGCQPLPLVRPPLHELTKEPLTNLPGQIERSSAACRYLDLLGQLDWQQWWQQIASLPSPGPSPNSLIPFVLAHLIKLDKGIRTMTALRNYLVMHPEVVWLLGFPLRACSYQPWGFDIQASVPPVSRFSQVLRRLENEALQLLLTETVRLLQAALPPDSDFGQTISLDTKHIIAWVSAPCHGVLYYLDRGCGQFAKPARSPPLAGWETRL